MKQNDSVQAIHAYQAANLTDEEVISSFVVRKKVFQRVFSEIRRDDMTGYSLALYQCLQNTLKMHKKRLLLLLDNIDRIFDNIQDEASLLRKTILTDGIEKITAFILEMQKLHYGSTS